MLYLKVCVCYGIELYSIIFRSQLSDVKSVKNPTVLQIVIIENGIYIILIPAKECASWELIKSSVGLYINSRLSQSLKMNSERIAMSHTKLG